MAVMAAPETVVDRIRRLVGEAIRSGRFVNEAEFLRSAKLSNAYLGEFAGRTALNPDATVRASTARRIADALGMSVDSLLGSGPAPEPPLVDIYPNRAWAIQAARNLDYPEAAIQAVLRLNPGRDLPKVAWFKRIEAEVESLLPASDPGR